MTPLHRCIEAVRTEMEALRFNTAIAKLIELNNHLTSLVSVPRCVGEPLVLMLAPFAPHAAEELWSRLGRQGTLAYEPFPRADPAKLLAETITYPIQIDGKLRASVEVAVDMDRAGVEAAARAHPVIAKRLEGAEITKLVVVPGRIVSIVLKR
jgi:leucyl-tRNA synthetase